MGKFFLDDSTLGKVSGGFNGITNCNNDPHCINVSQEEYDALVEGAFILDGKLENNKIYAAGEFLKSKGFEGCIYATGHVDLAHRRDEPAQYVDVKIIKE